MQTDKVKERNHNGQELRNPNMQEVKNEPFLIWTIQNNVHIFGIGCLYNDETNGQTDIQHEKDNLKNTPYLKAISEDRIQKVFLNTTSHLCFRFTRIKRLRESNNLSKQILNDCHLS